MGQQLLLLSIPIHMYWNSKRSSDGTVAPFNTVQKVGYNMVFPVAY